MPERAGVICVGRQQVGFTAEARRTRRREMQALRVPQLHRKATGLGLCLLLNLGKFQLVIQRFAHGLSSRTEHLRESALHRRLKCLAFLIGNSRPPILEVDRTLTLGTRRHEVNASR